MAKNTRTLDAYLDAWESKRMSGGRALTEAEHAVVLEVGELVARLRLPSDVSPELVDILRRHQNDAAGALQILAERFETSAIELDLICIGAVGAMCTTPPLNDYCNCACRP